MNLNFDFRSQMAELVAEIIKLNQIPAPTFEEGHKAEFVKACFETIGLSQVRRDRVGNVLAYLPGQDSRQEVVLAAHLDTVFPAGTDLAVKQENGCLFGAGIGDNNLAVAALLALARAFIRLEVKPRYPILFAATVGEEGLGDLYGIRGLLQDYQAEKRQISGLVAIEGHGLGNICHQGVGSRRMRVSISGPGGHSWDKAGKPSAIHGLAKLMQRMTEVPIPTEPRTSFNIGTIAGGISVNTIAPAATMVFEVRSLDEAVLAETFDKLNAIIASFEVKGLALETAMVGNRPAGKIPATSPIVELCRQVYQALKLEPTYVPFSTDANLALSLGLPAVCLGISRGGNAHRSDEWIEIEPAILGLQALAQITLGLAGHE